MAVQDHPSPPLVLALHPFRGLPRAGIPQESPAATTGAFGRVLSVALAMKGGVSLAVWIGGAVSEIDVLRRVRIVRDEKGGLAAVFIGDPGMALDSAQLPYVLRRADHYAALLISRGYDRIEVDVLAGASAGGLNAVLYGIAQRAGVAVDPLLNVWLESGSAWNLLRKPGFAAVPSALRGDYFWRQVFEAITKFYGGSVNPLHVAHDITVDLSATITDREYQSLPGKPEGRGHFHFVGTDAPQSGLLGIDASSEQNPSVTDGRNIPKKMDGVSARRIAYAARTTSSFPGAFEQAHIWSPTTTSKPVELTPFVPDPENPYADPTPVDMRFAFSAHRKETDGIAKPIRVMDGGILDNIPIDRLYRAVRDHRPTAYGDRIAVYLDPSPDGLPIIRIRPEHSDPPRLGDIGRALVGHQSFLETALTGAGMRGIRESESEETDRRGAALARIVRSETADFSLAAAHAGYRRYRSATDADLIERTLADPDLWQLTTDLPTRNRWNSTSPDDLRKIEAAFSTGYARNDASTKRALRTGAQALRDAALCTLDWMRAAEDALFERPAAFAKTRPQRDTTRKELHRISLIARRQRDLHLRHLLNTLRRANDGEVSPALNVGAVVDRWLADEGSRDVVSTWDELALGLVDLRLLCARIPGWANRQTPWADFPDDWSVFDLAAWVTPEGVPDPVSLMQFSRITAAVSTGLQERFTPLRDEQMADMVSEWLVLDDERFSTEVAPEHLPATLDPGAKLAGSTLGNFGAFFSKKWRMNDWWWGRLDAAAGIVDTLELLPPIVPAPTSPAAPIRIDRAAMQRLLLLQLNSAPTNISPLDEQLVPTGTAPVLDSAEESAFADRIAGSMSAGSHSLKDLKPAYLVSVASRAVHVAHRALLSGQSLPKMAAIVLVLPPVLGLVPMAFVTARLAFLTAALFATLTAIDVTRTTPALSVWNISQLPLPVGAAVLFGVGLVVTLKRNRRSRELEETLAPVFGGLAARARRARWQSASLLIVSGLAILAAAIRIGFGERVDPLHLFLCGVGAVLPLLAMSRSAKMSRATGTTSTAIWISLAVVLTVVMFVLPYFREGLSAVPTWVFVGIGATVSYAALSYGWLGSATGGDPGRTRGLPWWAAISLVVGVVGGGTAAFLLAATGRLDNSTTLGFSLCLGVGLAVWFACGHAGWWIMARWPTDELGDIDEPKFSKPGTA
jgi:patatin-related protein